mmetsp:Transcript_82742/g.146100  ORF Transcript_82742/g.146100 Transcript_82742/m.146100 type:complete len:269 (+) Transcript_82742:114-920(+)|eukprot:CAMPEP_0197623664 /NCGR_PEP_ID=MMETSP1338-20131121/3631_1 /TAXON_ID=43686 ORGANISM="Pelagodinium beii, Strain RCC1491" /NCGR_SAMPLE_ID=MMETSP1338 /ASSEMBLY_ACC=CAM_ASM_000754 /LENGTH=268 /DNA_ID=CAMNT_0043193711 /DNA_START=93 /DNA_END=899 /DNA_ORIENTATION=-
MINSPGCNDALLLISLTYSIYDLQYDSLDFFNSCSRPVHHWLLVSYVCVIAFRIVHILGARASSESAASNFLLDLRQKGTPRLLATFTWLVALPFFIVLTGLGTFWLWEVWRNTPTCIPSSSHLMFSCSWLALSYSWIFIHLALAGLAIKLEVQARCAEANLREIADQDTIARWGQVSQLTSSAMMLNQQHGLSPDEIRALPSSVAVAPDSECAICLNFFEAGDCTRQLPTCGHSFHRSCIDLWLLRSADCPLCKSCVRGDVRGDETA